MTMLLNIFVFVSSSHIEIITLQGPSFSAISEIIRGEHVSAICTLIASLQRCWGIWRLQEVIFLKQLDIFFKPKLIFTLVQLRIMTMSWACGLLVTSFWCQTIEFSAVGLWALRFSCGKFLPLRAMLCTPLMLSA